MSRIRLIAYGLLLAAVMGGVLYVRHLQKQAARVPALIETLNAEHEARKQEAAAAQKSLELEHDLQERLAESRARAADLARRLRHYFQSVPETAAPSSGAEGTGGNGSGSGTVADELTNVIGACQRDAIRLNGWIEWYEQVPDSLK